MGNNINGVRERLERACIDEHGITWLTAEVYGADLRALLADHARLQEELRKTNAGETVSVRFDLSPAAKEGAVRDQLVAMGWTPPGVATAIDLEQFREPVEHFRNSWAGFAETMRKAGRSDESANGKVANCDHLLALIDGHVRSSFEHKEEAAAIDPHSLEKRTANAVQFLQNELSHADSRDAKNPFFLSRKGRGLQEAAECISGLVNEVYRLRQVAHQMRINNVTATVHVIDMEQFRLSVDGALLSLNRLGGQGFECEAGPLADSVDYAALRERLDRLLALIDGQANVRSSSEHSDSLTPVAHKKLQGLQADGFIVNGLAIFNPTTGQRGLVDYLGYVGWQTSEQPTEGEGVAGG